MKNIFRVIWLLKLKADYFVSVEKYAEIVVL
jgi:hypothetical protein